MIIRRVKATGRLLPVIGFALIAGLLPNVAVAAGDTEKPAVASPAGQTPYEKKYYADPFYQELVTTAAASKSTRDLLAFMNHAIEENPQRIHPASLWLRDNSIGQRDLTKVNALYFLSYSDVTGQLAAAYNMAGDKDGGLAMTKTAMMALYIYELMATVDAARCSDPTALTNLRQSLFARYEGLNDAFKILKKSDFDLFASEAFIADRKFEKRLGNDYICSLGDAKMNDEMRQEGTKTRTIDDPNRPGLAATEVLPPNGYHFEPGYIDDTEWEKRRVKTREEVRQIWNDRYARLTAPVASTPAPEEAPALPEREELRLPAPHPAPPEVH